MHLVIRADGGHSVGYGHLSRSGALGEEFLARGHSVTVATTTPQPAQEVFPDTVQTAGLSSRGNPEPFIDWLGTANPDVVFTDAYPVDTEYQHAIRECVPLAVLQDDDRHAVCADLFTNGNLYAPGLAYEFVGERPEQYLGPDYVLLRQEIRKAATDEPPWREQPERAIIMMGGSDIAGLTPTVVRAFDGCEFRVDAIVGPGCSVEQKKAIYDAANACTADVHVNSDPVDLADRMIQADFAVSTASSTTYELLALGTPIVSVPVVENQEPIAEELAERDLATVLDGDTDIAAFSAAIRDYVTNSSMRRRRRDVGRRLVDGRGVERVCTQMLSLTETNRGA